MRQGWLVGLLHNADFIQLIYSGHPSGTVEGSIPGRDKLPLQYRPPNGLSPGILAPVVAEEAHSPSFVSRQGTPVLLLDAVDAAATVDDYQALRSRAHASTNQRLQDGDMPPYARASDPTTYGHLLTSPSTTGSHYPFRNTFILLDSYPRPFKEDAQPWTGTSLS